MFLWRYFSLTQTSSCSRESFPISGHSWDLNRSTEPGCFTLWAACRWTLPRKPQHVLESASVPSWLPITRLFSPPLFPMTCCGFANLPEGRRCLPCCSTAEPCELNPSVWVGRQTAINHSVSKEILFTALLKTLNHKMWGHCVWNELTQLLWA